MCNTNTINDGNNLNSSNKNGVLLPGPGVGSGTDDPGGCGATKLLDQYVDTLVRKAEQPHNNKEDQILQKQQILEELQRVERELHGKVISTSNYLSISPLHQAATAGSPVAQGIQACGGAGCTVAGSAVAGTSSIAGTGNFCHLPGTQTVETQTAFLPGGAGWQLLPHPLGDQLATGTVPGVSRGSSGTKTPISSERLPAYGGSASVQASERAQVPTATAFAGDVPTYAASGPIPPHFATSGPATSNVPVSERRKMIPTKKKDKKQLQQQLQQKQLQMQQGQSLQTPESGIQFGCSTSTCGQGSSIGGSALAPPPPPGVLHPSSSTVSNRCLPPPPPPLPCSAAPSSTDDGDGLRGVEKSPDFSTGLGTRGKKDKKRSVPTDCDCGVSPDEIQSLTATNKGVLTQTDKELLIPQDISELAAIQLASTAASPTGGLGAVSGGTAGVSGGLQFVPANGLGSTGQHQHLQFAPFTSAVPLQYGHLSALNVATTPGGIVGSATTPGGMPAGTLQVVNNTSNAGGCCSPGGNQSGSHPAAKSQVKQFLLQPPYTSSTPTAVDGSNRPGASGFSPLLKGSSPPTNILQQQYAQAQQHLQSSNAAVTAAAQAKKTKKPVRISVSKQDRDAHQLQQLSAAHHQQGIITSNGGAINNNCSNLIQDQQLKQQTTTQQAQVVTASTGLTLDAGNQGVVYPNTMIHFQAPSPTLQTLNSSGVVTSYAPNQRVNESGLMVATHATPAKILNDQMPEMITSTAQVCN